MSFLLDFDSLPTLPVIVQQVMKEMNNPYSSIKDIALIIERDQSMSAKILKLVNSAFYGFSKRIATVSHAVGILGFENVKSLILGVSILDTFKIKEFNIINFWKHSIQTASLSAYISKRLDYPQTEESFTLGLIHDLGKLIFMLKSPKIYHKILSEYTQSNQSILELERKYLKMDHAFVGAQVVRLWNFPSAYIQAIDGHHSQSCLNDQSVSLRQILYLSNLICHLNAGDLKEPVDIKIFSRFGINLEDTQKYLVSIETDIAEFLQTIH